jgi:hypothetical protein
MDKRGEIGTLNEQIQRLMNREKLTEDEVKTLCEKVRPMHAHTRAHARGDRGARARAARLPPSRPQPPPLPAAPPSSARAP